MTEEARAAYPQNVFDLAKNDPELKALMPSPDLAKQNLAALPYHEAFEKIFATYGSRPAFGTRDYEVKRDPVTGRAERVYLPHFTTVSFKQVSDQVKKLAATLRRQKRIAQDDFAVCLGFNSLEYATIDLALFYEQAVPVPVQSTLTDADLREVFENTAPVAVFATIFRGGVPRETP